MKKRNLTSNLSIDGIKKLQQELKQFEQEINRKNVIFVRRLAELGIPIIDSRIAQAQGDSNKSHNTYVKITSYQEYARAVLTVEGRDLLFIEFGAGVHYNGAVGQSPNPKGAEMGYTIGSYGQGKGTQDSWVYYADTGEWIRSYGTEATMPVYMASQEMIKNIKRIAKQVFSS